MAVTSISEVIVPEVFAQYVIRETAERSRLFQSGLLVADGSLSAFLAGGGNSINLPNWSDLWATGSGDDDNNVSSDAASAAAPAAVGATADIALRHNRNKGWSSYDLTAAFAGDDPMRMIVSRVADYWANALERTFVSTLMGITADNLVANAGDMVNDQSIVALAPEMILDTAQTMGDAQDRLAVIVMHSAIYNSLAKLNLIDFIPDSEGRTRFPSYMGYEVIRDDDCPEAAGVYDTYLCARDSFAWGEGSPRVPVETYRYPAQGDGGGSEELWSRREFVMHPRGFAAAHTWTNNKSPTDAELQVDGAFGRVAPERKQVGIAILKSLV